MFIEPKRTLLIAVAGLLPLEPIRPLWAFVLDQDLKRGETV